MKPTTPQFATVAEVREFMGDHAYARIFAQCTDKQVLSITRTGMHYTTSELPAIKYAKHNTLEDNFFIALQNARIRNEVTGVCYKSCQQIEVRRVVTAGFREVAEALNEDFDASNLRPTRLKTPNDPQFINLDEVREFTGDYFETVFVKCTEQHIMTLVANGMEFVGTIPLFKYAADKGGQYNLPIISNNIQLRVMLTHHKFEESAEAEGKRAIAAGVPPGFHISAEYQQ